MSRLLNLIFISVSFAAAIDAAYSPCSVCITRASPSRLANISLRLYPSQSIDSYIAVPIENASDLIEEIDPTRPTVMYISGWTETTNSTSVRTVLGAYFERDDHNVILLNYEDIAQQPYPYAALSVDGVGYTVANGLDQLVAAGLNSSSLHIVGHSLGGQVAGRIGRYANCTVGRITGLDPAGPGFDYIGDNLSFKDAEFVDIIHTDAGKYGSTKSTGTVMFYPNGGTRLQPGCPRVRVPLISDEDFCDHRRAWEYYAESLLKVAAFIGAQCSSNTAFKLDLCGSNSRVVMGFGTPRTASGRFYLQTNSESPYGRGEDGVDYRAESLFSSGR